MSYQQVRDILNDIREHHRKFRKALAHVEEQSGQKADVEWIANGLRRHEEHWETALARYGREGEESILNTWVQFTPDESIREALDDLVVKPDMTLEDVTELAVKFHTSLVETYATLSRAVSAPRAQELFSRLLELEQTVAAEQAWSGRNT